MLFFSAPHPPCPIVVISGSSGLALNLAITKTDPQHQAMSPAVTQQKIATGSVTLFKKNLALSSEVPFCGWLQPVDPRVLAKHKKWILEA